MKTMQKPAAGAEPRRHKPTRNASLAQPVVVNAVRPTPSAHSPIPPPARPSILGAFLPTALCLLLVGIHLFGLALLNWEDARRVWLQKEAIRLQQQNEALRARLNSLSAEPLMRRWAEAQGMVRAETRSAQTVQIRPLATRESAEGKWHLASRKSE